jgi:pseudouridine synthase
VLKLQHFLSKQGIFSRRVAARMIEEGYVLVNGALETNPLYMVADTDTVTFAKKIETYIDGLGVVCCYKPRGVWTNCKQGEGEKEVVDLLPPKYRQYASIGRLDKDSEGLILMTNDGVFANQFLNAGEVHERCYIVWTHRPLTPAHKAQFQQGLMLEDGPTQPCKLTEQHKGCYTMILTEGRNLQIRRMVQACGTYVTRLKRVQFSTYNLGKMVPGQYRWESLSHVFVERVAQAERVGLLV